MSMGSQSRIAALSRWAAAALVVAAAHGTVAWVAMGWRPAEAAAGAPEPAIMIELAALSVPQEAPPEALPPAPEPVAPEQPPEPVKEALPPEPEPEPPPPEPTVEQPVEPVPDPTPVQAPDPDIKLPELPQVPDALAVLNLPKPVPAKPELEPKPKPKIVERKPVERKPIARRIVERREKPVRHEAAAPPPSPARSAAPAQTQGATARPSAAATASWRGALIAHLNRYKRFPGGASPGTVQVAFSIDRGGRVLSARLAGSSGDSALDAEAVGMVRRASPVPAPPDGLGGGVIALAVPVRFTR